MKDTDYLGTYTGKTALVTGGLGFIGSNLALRLADLGANVTLVDSMIPDYGGNLFNIAGYENRLQVNIADVRDPYSMRTLVRGQDVLFNLAGQVSHVDSMQDPFTDLEINARSQLSILEACRHENPEVKIVYAGTRQQYGKPKYLPLDEQHLQHPTDVNGVNKLAGEWYHIVYHNAYGLRTSSLRLTNTYGPRQLMKHNRQGFIAWFIRLAVEGKEIQIYGDGQQRRDLCYVDDVVDAFLRVGASEKADGEVFNLGGLEPVSLLDLAHLLIDIAQQGKVDLVPWPEERKRIDIGDVYSSYARIETTLGWTPVTSVQDGLAETIDYYRQYSQYYWRAMSGMLEIPVIDLHRQYEEIRQEIDDAVSRTLSSGWYILGREVAGFEHAFAAYLQGEDSDPVVCVGVNSGTDALQLALAACEIAPGDEVITVAHTAVATAAAIVLSGATPVFVDIDPLTFTMDPASLQAAISPQTKAIIPVHIYGHAADMDAILAVARKAGVRVIEDCAQAHGARYRGKPVGILGDLGCFSFYPTKNLGAMGDGGAVVSRYPDLADRVRLLREYGWRPDARYVSQVPGMNSRLDELQAAILRVKLGYLDDWNAARRLVASRYAQKLPESMLKPIERPDCDHVFHLYVVRTRHRDAVRSALLQNGIGTGIHYPVPIHLQPAYRGSAGGDPVLPQTEQAAHEILSLPMHPHLRLEQVDRTAEALRRAVASDRANPTSE